MSLNRLYNWIKILSQLLAHSEALFIIDDIITDESRDKNRQSLLELDISGRHLDHYGLAGQDHIYLVSTGEGRS